MGPKKEILRFDYEYDSYKRHIAQYKMAVQIMSKEIISIAPEASTYEAAELMGAKHIGSLIVVEYDTPVGIISERDLLTKILAEGKNLKKEKVKNSMSYPIITIYHTMRIKEAAQIMITEHVRRLAVFSDQKLMGIVTASDLIRSLPEIPETAIRVDDLMTEQVITAEEKTPVSALVKTMGQHRIGSVVITSKGKPTGIFTERDLFTKIIANNKPLKSKVSEHFSSPLISIPIMTSVHKAALIMGIKHIRRLPVIKKTKLVGIVTARDLVEAYAK